MPADDINHRQPKSWTKLTIESDTILSETISAFVADITGAGVEFNNCFTPGTKTQVDSISAYILQDSELNQKLERVHLFLQNLSNQHPKLIKPSLDTELIIEEDWGNSWKRHFEPFQATNRLIIKPSWEKYISKGEQHIIEMDPGMAFGTGMHASTNLALELVEQIFLPDKQIPRSTLDVGTGTGILGISCALLGCKKVIGIDTDIDAREAAVNNIRRNNLEKKMVIVDQSLNEMDGRFDLILANIIFNTLVELAKPLTDRLAQRGHLIMAGILTGSQTDSIINTYRNMGLDDVTTKQKDEWSAICMRLK